MANRYPFSVARYLNISNFGDSQYIECEEGHKWNTVAEGFSTEKK